MANTVTITKINEGPRNAVFHIYLASDGAEGELTDQVIIDPVADLGLSTEERMVVDSICYSLSGFDARVEFDTGLVEDKMIWLLTPNNSFIDFTKFGGLKDRSGLDGTAKLQITTTGFSDATDQGSIVIHARR